MKNVKNELTSLDANQFIWFKFCTWFGLMLPVLATLRLLKVGDANGAELALLGGPAVLC